MQSESKINTNVLLEIYKEERKTVRDIKRENAKRAKVISYWGVEFVVCATLNGYKIYHRTGLFQQFFESHIAAVDYTNKFNRRYDNEGYYVVVTKVTGDQVYCDCIQNIEDYANEGSTDYDIYDNVKEALKILGQLLCSCTIKSLSSQVVVENYTE